MRDCVLDEVKRKSVVGAMMDWQVGSEFEGSSNLVQVLFSNKLRFKMIE
jgi:hypothetical protein